MHYRWAGNRLWLHALIYLLYSHSLALCLEEADPLLTLSTFILTLYQQQKWEAAATPSTQIKVGCAVLLWCLLERLPTWKYHIPVLSRGLVCNCVLSDLQSRSHSFVPDIFLQRIYFSISGIFAVVPLVTKFSSFFPSSPCALWASDKTMCENCTFYEKRALPSSRKGHIV